MKPRFAGTAAVIACLASTAVLAQTGTAPDLFLAGPETYAPHYDRPPKPPPRHPVPVLPYVIWPGPYDWHPARTVHENETAGSVARERHGRLRLIVEPRSAQIFVDGFFVGSVEDYPGGDGPLLEAGRRPIELRAEGYETAAFEVTILPGTVVTHRRSLTPLDSPPRSVSASPPNRAARTIYVIPRCYAGDSPPRQSELPAGCNAADVRIVP